MSAVSGRGAAVPAATDLHALVDGLGAVVWEADAATRRCSFVSRHAETLLGHPTRRWLDEPDFLASLIHPDDRADVVDARWGDVPKEDVPKEDVPKGDVPKGDVPKGDVHSGDVPGDVRSEDVHGRDDFELTYRAVAADGRVVWLRDLVHVVRDADGAARRLQGVLVDISAQRAAEERHRFLAVLERELQRLDGAEEVMAAATRLLGEHLGADRCAYARTEADEDHFVMSGDHATGLPPLPGRFAMAEFGEGALRAMRAGEPWVVVDSLNDPRLEGEDLAAYQVTGIRAVICLPLLRGGRFVAAMAVHQATARDWTPDEVELVSVAVNRCWESLQRTHADRALRDSEQRHRLLVERATDGIWVLDRELRFVEVNPAACVLLGYRRNDLIDRRVTELVVDGDGHGERLARLVADLSTARVTTEVWDMRRADGSVVAMELSIQATPTGVQAIGRDVTERRRAEAERERLLQREHEIAEALQRSLLPRELPALDRLATSARYLPASTHSRIGGDWYEILPLTGTTVALSVGDVVGKGPTAAAVMGQLRSALAGYLLDGHSPAAALERLDAFTARVNGATGSTCACLTFDWDTGRLCWAVAGHPPPVIVDAEQARFLAGDTGSVLGAPGRRPYREHTTSLAPGASVVLYTDGLVERRGAPTDQGLERLLDAVRGAHGLAPEALTTAITDALLTGDQDDDVALVVARHLPRPLRATVPALPGELAVMRRNVAAWASIAGLSADLFDDLQLTLGEAAANSVDHAYPPGKPGDFSYEIATTAEGIHVTVRDQGRWRPEPADPGHRGRGLQIIRTLARHSEFHRGGDGTTVAFDLVDSQGSTPAPHPPAPSATTGSAEESGCGVGESAAGAPVQVLRLTGDVDTDSADDLLRVVLDRICAPDHRPVEIDLTDVRYLSSSGIALLLQAAATATHVGRVLTVAAAEGSAPARVLALSGLHGLTNGALDVHTRRS